MDVNLSQIYISSYHQVQQVKLLSTVFFVQYYHEAEE